MKCVSPNLPLALAMLCLQTSCGPTHSPEDRAPEVRRTALPALCDGSRMVLEVTPHLHTIQEQSNTLVRGSESLYIVESGANALSRVELDDETLRTSFIDVGNDKNPYDAFVDEARGQIFVTNYLGGSVSVADMNTGEVVAEFGKDRLISPSGVAATSTHVYVSDVEFGRGENGFGPGAVHVFEQQSWQWVGKIATDAQNPHYISVVPGTSDTLLVTDAGAVGFLDGRFRQISRGAIERWTLGENPLEPRVEVADVPTQPDPSRDGAPGRPMFSSQGGQVHMVSATAPVMMTLDASSMQWIAGPSDPITLYESDQDTLHAGDVLPGGLVLILSYNQDALYLYDPACSMMIAGPIDLGTSSQDLEGPLSIVVSGDTEAYFITSLSKRLGKITLRPQ